MAPPTPKFFLVILAYAIISKGSRILGVSYNVYLFRWGITSWMVVECRNVEKSAAMDYLWESTLNALFTIGPQLWDPPHKVTPLRQVAKDCPVNVVLALSKDHT
jgi:hypothetical protein